MKFTHSPTKMVILEPINHRVIIKNRWKEHISHLGNYSVVKIQCNAFIITYSIRKKTLEGTNLSIIIFWYLMNNIFTNHSLKVEFEHFSMSRVSRANLIWKAKRSYTVLPVIRGFQSQRIWQTNGLHLAEPKSHI